jgi:hypothetical protein
MAEECASASYFVKEEGGEDSFHVGSSLVGTKDDNSPDREVQEVLRYQLNGPSREGTCEDKPNGDRREFIRDFVDSTGYRQVV